MNEIFSCPFPVHLARTVGNVHNSTLFSCCTERQRTPLWRRNCQPKTTCLARDQDVIVVVSARSLDHSLNLFALVMCDKKWIENNLFFSNYYLSNDSARSCNLRMRSAWIVDVVQIKLLITRSCIFFMWLLCLGFQPDFAYSELIIGRIFKMHGRAYNPSMEVLWAQGSWNFEAYTK